MIQRATRILAALSVPSGICVHHCSNSQRKSFFSLFDSTTVIDAPLQGGYDSNKDLLNTFVPEIGISFSPAGLLTPFHIGASVQLRKLGFIDSKTALAGSSGGALAAITTALDVDPKKTLQYCAYIARRCRDDGPRLTLRTALDEVLDEVIQDESITTLNNRLASCFVAYFELFPGFKAQFTKDFASKDDLMDVLRASCNIPFYFNGNAPCVGVRGGGGVDGFFTVDLPRFGCPPTGSTKTEIIVCPYPASQVGLVPDISTCNYLTHREVPQSIVKYELITPDLLGPEFWPYEPLEVLSMSIAAPRISRSSRMAITGRAAARNGNYASDVEIDEIYASLYNAGVQAVTVWNNNRVNQS